MAHAWHSGSFFFPLGLSHHTKLAGCFLWIYGCYHQKYWEIDGKPRLIAGQVDETPRLIAGPPNYGKIGSKMVLIQSSF